MKYCVESINYFFLIGISLKCWCNGEYRFEEETIENVYPCASRLMDDSNILYQSSKMEQTSLCHRAQEIVLADPLEPQQVGFEVAVGVLEVHSLDGSIWLHTVLMCPSIPRIYMRVYENLNHQKVIKIMQEKNDYIMGNQYMFIPQIVHSIRRVGDYEQEIEKAIQATLNGNYPNLESEGSLPYLAYRNHLQRRAMCIAARKHCSFAQIKIISDTWIEPIEKYEIQHFEGQQSPITVAAFSCNSEPKIHLCHHHKYSKYEIMVTILQEWFLHSS